MGAVGFEAQGGAACDGEGLPVDGDAEFAGEGGDEFLRASRMRFGLQAAAGVYLDVEHLKTPGGVEGKNGEVAVTAPVLKQRLDLSDVDRLVIFFGARHQVGEGYLQAARV